ncbi:MAG: rod shape-determining protein RodA [Bacteroidales bacterium]|nr:rod shape-determining protein RodA [Bacteroidales bacterium]
MAILLICNSLNGRNWTKWVLISIGIILLIALFPSFWHRIVGTFIPGVSALEHNPDVTVVQTIKEGAHLFFLSKIKPLYILIATALGLAPYLVIKAFHGRNTTFKMLSIIGFFAGVMMVFSTDFIFNDVLQPHQRKRIEVLLGLKEDPAGVGYNVNQSLIAIGSGGFLGKGYLNGTQTTYGFVPEQATDFIFCTVGEEWGFVGCSVVIFLYLFLIWRILYDAERSREAFTRIYGYCVASCVFMHLFINIGMTIGIMPVIGIPLPLLSYGGSSLWAFTVLIFIFIALDREEKKYF